MVRGSIVTVKSAAMATASIAALVCALPSSASAQTAPSASVTPGSDVSTGPAAATAPAAITQDAQAPTPNQPSATPAVETPLSSEPDAQVATADASDIVVTGTRVVRDGYKAPTPTTVIGAADIAANAPANLADFVNRLPSLAGSSTPRTTISAISAGNAGINALNLRNLGVNRTLVLLDGQRVGASSLGGLVDVNQFPQGLVKRVDVVTGGASAGWGSDAIAGVVNFVLDRDYKGLKGEVQGGVTTYGDDEIYRVSLTAGTDFGGSRAHFIISGEAAYNAGVTGIGDRKWYNATKVFNNPAYTATNGLPQLLVRAGSGFANATPGGIITAGMLRGTYFGEGGTPLQFNYGPIVSGNFMQGGQSAYADFGTSGDLDPKLTRQNVFARIGIDLADNFEVFGQLSYGRATSDVGFGYQANYGTIVIRPDNAFIPAAIASRVTANFNLGTFFQDLGVIRTSTERQSWRPVVGFKGSFNALRSEWTYDAYGQKTITNSDITSRVSITANLNNAIDAVRNANGAIVCRSTLTNPTNGCVPFNVFGTGVNSQAPLDYILGDSFGHTEIEQTVIATNLRGNPFSTWAGPVSIALGLEHRVEEVSGSNDALRSTALAANAAAPYFAGNYLATNGRYNVNEGYLETVVPLAKDMPFAHSLDLNGAVRLTDYSTSGRVTTWKAGVTYSPIEDVTFRFVRSRDIRAPNLGEYFTTAQTITTTFTDPFRNNTSTTLAQITRGNPALDPEKANSLGLGVVVQPRFLPGFAASVDYYRIDIDGAIQTVTASTLVAQCFSGNAALCSQITRATSGTLINGYYPLASVTVLPVNLARQLARGLDFEASYRRPVFGGNLTLRFIGTRYLENYFDNGINKPTDNVGQNNGRGSAAASLPKFSYTGSVGWDNDTLSIFVLGRGFSKGVYDTSYIECTSGCPVSTVDNMTIENNRLPGAIYFDANVAYKVTPRAEMYLSVDNILNKDPAAVAWASGGAPLSVNQALYDTLGRRFRVGLRFKM